MLYKVGNYAIVLIISMRKEAASLWYLYIPSY